METKEEKLDELQIRTPWMKGIVGKLLSKFISKKLGKKIEIHFTHISVKNYENGLRFDIAANGEISKEELSKALSEVGL